jgi:thioredoxin 2
VVRQAARELAGNVAVVQINTDDNHHLGGRFSVRGIPALVLLKNGKVIDSRSGALDLSTLLAWVKPHQPA